MLTRRSNMFGWIGPLALLLTFSPPGGGDHRVGHVELDPGANLVGIPVDWVSVPNLSSLLGVLGPPDHIASVSRLNPYRRLLELCAYDDAGQAVGLGCTAPVMPGEGWIVEALSSTIVDYDIDLSCPSIDLRRGVNLITLSCAYEGLDSHGLLRALEQRGIQASVQMLDQDRGRWYTAATNEGTPVGPSFPLLLDQAYLIGSNRSVSLTPPLADAGPPRIGVVGHTVSLNGTGSRDYNGDALAYSWTLVEAPGDSSADLLNADTARPELEPDQPGSYRARLIVQDGIMQSAPSETTIVVELVDLQAPIPPDPLRIGVALPANGTVAVTGREGAAETGSTVTTTNLRSGDTVTEPVDDEGRFSLDISAVPGDESRPSRS